MTFGRELSSQPCSFNFRVSAPIFCVHTYRLSATKILRDTSSDSVGLRADVFAGLTNSCSELLAAKTCSYAERSRVAVSLHPMCFSSERMRLFNECICLFCANCLCLSGLNSLKYTSPAMSFNRPRVFLSLSVRTVVNTIACFAMSNCSK